MGEGNPRGGSDREQGPARLRRAVSDVTLRGATLRLLRSQKSMEMYPPGGAPRSQKGRGSDKGTRRLDDGPEQGVGGRNCGDTGRTGRCGRIKMAQRWV